LSDRKSSGKRAICETLHIAGDGRLPFLSTALTMKDQNNPVDSMKKLAVFALLAAFSTWHCASAAPPEGPASTISVYAGGAFMRDYYDNCGYYDDCGGYYDSSDTYSGPEFGADARIVMPVGLLLDLSAEHARVSDRGDTFLEQQFTAGLGYEGRIGRYSSWYVEGFYQYYRLGENFNGCDYSCNGWFKSNGGGAKGGATWRFSERFYGDLNLRISYLSGQDSDIDLVQAKLDGSMGYMITNNFSLAIGFSSQALEQTNDRRYNYNYGNYYDRPNDTLSHTSVFLKAAVHF
jgi:hypothetical protein